MLNAAVKISKKVINLNGQHIISRPFQAVTAAAADAVAADTSSNPVGTTPASPSSPRNPSSTTQARPLSSAPSSALHAAPTTSKPGGRLPSASIASATRPSVVRITRWSGQLARSITAHGVVSGHSARFRLFTSSLSAAGTEPSS